MSIANYKQHAIIHFSIMQYLHSNGIIHGDLRPRNFLIDEYGILKLADFKFAQKIPKETLGEIPFANRGCAPYMSPELFTDGGVHSFQSDFWALGCVLYELRRGFLPFGEPSANSLDALVERIRSIDPIASPFIAQSNSGTLSTLSPELADCLSWLLEKAPMNRCSWPALCAHPFWAPSNPSPPSDLPPQPAFDALIRALERARSAQLEQATNAEFDLQIASVSKSVMSAVPVAPPAQQQTPLKLPVYGSTPMRDEVARLQHNSASAGVATPNRTGILSTVDEQSTPVVNHRNPSTKHGLQVHEEENTPRSRVPTPIANGDRMSPHPPATPVNPTSNYLSSAMQSPGSPTRLPEDRNLHDVQSTGYLGASATSSVLLHPSELQVKPIVGNKLIENIDGFDYSPSTLSFDSSNPEALNSMSASDIESHLTIVYKALHKTAVTAQSAAVTSATNQALSDRVNILKYLCAICSSAEVSHLSLNIIAFANRTIRISGVQYYPQYAFPHSRAQTTPQFHHVYCLFHHHSQPQQQRDADRSLHRADLALRCAILVCNASSVAITICNVYSTPSCENA